MGHKEAPNSTQTILIAESDFSTPRYEIHRKGKQTDDRDGRNPTIILPSHKFWLNTHLGELEEAPALLPRAEELE